jgi:hypothetical protein
VLHLRTEQTYPSIAPDRGVTRRSDYTARAIRDPRRFQAPGRGGLPKPLVDRMHADYWRLGSIAKMCALYGRTRQAIWDIFRTHGKKLRSKVFQKKVRFGGREFSMHSGYLTATSGDRVLLHHAVWIRKNGPIPPGHNLLFRDGNRRNCALGNLRCLPIAEVSRITSPRKNQYLLTLKGVDAQEDAIASRAPRYWRISMRRIPLGLLDVIHADYLKGVSLAKLGRHHRIKAAALPETFIRRGFKLRPPAGDDGQGSQTDRQIASLAKVARRFRVPRKVLKLWKRWSLAQRAVFIAELRKRFWKGEERPVGPYSEGMTPFDYGTPLAHLLIANVNAGGDQWHKAGKLDIRSQGVIWRNELWFWTNGFYRRSAFVDREAEPGLHQVIWKEANGCEIPKEHVVSFSDGNRNNFAPSNLVLMSREEILSITRADFIVKTSRAKTDILLRRSQGARTKRNAPDLLQAVSQRRRV